MLMRNRNIIILIAATSLVVATWWFNGVNPDRSLPVVERPVELSGPAQFALFHKQIRTAPGDTAPAYASGYRLRESRKARTLARSRNRMLSSPVVWTERGPANVPGRTRGLIVDPDDPTKNTWYAGSAGGGVWKTTNAGTSWTLLTPDLSNLATTVLAMAPSNHDIIYLGTGEGFGNLDGITGNGIFKSINRGVSWTHLSSTISFQDVNRLAVDPANSSIVVAATITGIYRTTDGGDNWTQVSSLTNVQDLKATPGNFNIQYAAKSGVGILKSTDAGINWVLSNNGMSPGGRTEIAVSPVNPNRVFASAEGGLSGGTGDLYVSQDAGATWSLVDVSYNGSAADFLGGQGWYDNTVACDPFNASAVYVGGVNVFRVTLGTGSSEVPNYSMEEDDTESFLFLQAFANILYDGQRLTAGPAAGNKKVEVRFGPGLSQFAHRFTVPAGATSGVPALSYSYAGYVEVPFQAWDVTNPIAPRQLMVSFRDQANNGEFDLVTQFFGADPALNSREYTYINDVNYSATPNSSIAVAGGHEHQFIYTFFPSLASGATWDPDNLPLSTLQINYTGVPKMNASTTIVSDAYNQFDGKNRFITFGTDVHPDQHNLVMIPVTGSTYRILLANDGGIFLSSTSSTPGITNGEWAMSGRTYRTTQFYGADKRPGFDHYVGGTQDNGTWKSPDGGESTAATNFAFCFGGDGFEVIWHNLDDRKIIGGSQGNVFRRSLDGGLTWSTATSGLSGSHPFISKLANSKSNPDRIYTLSSSGVFRSLDFGGFWSLTPITTKWGSSSLMDVEVSRANANIVWAGSGMSGTTLSLHVSTDAGQTFSAAENPPSSLIAGGITKLASHPFQENTAYALFSQAGNPKILRTMDLGQTWEDISGFETGDVSTRGFPDVAVYCLYVRQDNPDILWAGTEIGIVESLDNGLSWTLIDEFPNISVWDMKGQDNQVVIATHGRGIWTATLEESQNPKRPEIVNYGTSPKKQLMLKVNLTEDYSKLEFYNNVQLIGQTNAASSGDVVVSLPAVTPGMKSIKIIGYHDNAPVHSKTYSLEKWDVKDVTTSHAEYFGNVNGIVLNGFVMGSFQGDQPGQLTLHSAHPYSSNADHRVVLLYPVVVAASQANVQYKDVALVEPALDGALFDTPDFNDYVVMEASKNGLDWIPIEDGYNARHVPEWATAFAAGTAGSRSLLQHHQVNLLDKFVAGDTLLFRYRLYSNASVTGWGAAVDYIAIQEEPTALASTPGKDQLFVYPNPTPSDATARYSINTSSDAVLEILDLAGRVVHTQSKNHQAAGTYETSLPMRTLVPGTYVLRLSTAQGVRTTKIVVSR